MGVNLLTLWRSETWLRALEVPGGVFAFKSSVRGASPGQGDAESRRVLGTILIPAWMEGEGRSNSIPQASEGTASPLLVALGSAPPHPTHSISLCLTPPGQQDLVLAVQQGMGMGRE